MMFLHIIIVINRRDAKSPPFSKSTVKLSPSFTEQDRSLAGFESRFKVGLECKSNSILHGLEIEFQRYIVYIVGLH